MNDERDPIAFPRLTDEQIEIFRQVATETNLSNGEALWKPGDTEFCFFVVLEGEVEIRDGNPDSQSVAIHGAGGFTGDVDVLSGRPAPVGGYAKGSARLLQVSAEALREIVRVEQDLGGIVLLAFIRRRELLLNMTGRGLLLVGSAMDPETMRIRQFLGRNRVLHRWEQPEESGTARLLEGFGLGVADTPMVFLANQRLSKPTLEDLGERLGIRLHVDARQYDLVIIGAGPAGLAAAVYGASEGLHTLLLDRTAPGGQASWSSRIENYMGFPEGLTGSDLAARGLVQAQKFGTDISIPGEVANIECGPVGHRIHLRTGETIDARAIIVATGATYQKLPIPGFERFETSGIYYAATKLEMGSCEGAEVVVVGAGNSAGQAAVYLSAHCAKVRLVVRGDRLNKSMSDYLSYRVERIPNIEVFLNAEVSALEGDDHLTTACLTGPATVPEKVPCTGLFVFIGAEPNTDFLKDTVARDRNGFILTGDAAKEFWPENRTPYYLETSCSGIFAAGDCRVGSVKRVASSVGEGSMAVTFVHRVLAL